MKKISLVISILFLTANVFAQKNAEDVKSVSISETPKVIQVDEITIKKLLKPDGKPLLVNFWATWCVPCQEEFPDLVEIDKEFKGKIDFITITLDDLAEIDRDVPKFLAEMKATMPTYLLRTTDENGVIGSISKEWQGGLPFTVLYDEKGDIVHAKQGKIKIDVVKFELNKLIGSTEKSKVSDLQIYNLSINKSNLYSYEKGVEDAKKDVSEGKFIIKYYGLVPMASSESTKNLKQKYGIEIIYNGCLVSPGMIDYGKGYNQISKAAIKQKFDLDF